MRSSNKILAVSQLQLCGRSFAEKFSGQNIRRFNSYVFCRKKIQLNLNYWFVRKEIVQHLIVVVHDINWRAVDRKILRISLKRPETNWIRETFRVDVKRVTNQKKSMDKTVRSWSIIWGGNAKKQHYLIGTKFSKRDRWRSFREAYIRKAESGWHENKKKSDIYK